MHRQLVWMHLRTLSTGDIPGPSLFWEENNMASATRGNVSEVDHLNLKEISGYYGSMQDMEEFLWVQEITPTGDSERLLKRKSLEDENEQKKEGPQQ